VTHRDDELVEFAAHGVELPAGGHAALLEHDGARLWHVSYGQGPAVVLLHGGMGHSGNFAHQVPALLAAGYRAILIDSRGQGRSSWDGRPFSYARMARDVRAVLAGLGVERAAFVGWSDGACTALVLADTHPEQMAGLFFFACNVDAGGAKPFAYTETIGRCLGRHRADFAALSPTPEAFDTVFEAVGEMQRTQPDYDAADLARIRVPVHSVLGEFDEFITPEHAAYIAQAIPGAELVRLPGVSHFAPLQRPDVFNAAMLGFLAKILPLR